MRVLIFVWSLVMAVVKQVIGKGFVQGNSTRVEAKSVTKQMAASRTSIGMRTIHSMQLLAAMDKHMRRQLTNVEWKASRSHRYRIFWSSA